MRLACLLSGVLLGLAGVAHADPDRPASTDDRSPRDRARALVEQAQKAEKEGRFLEAASLHKKAYEVVPHPTLIFNIAQAYRRGGKKAEACVYYQRYLESESSGHLAEVSRRFERGLERELDSAEIEQARQRIAEESIERDPIPPAAAEPAPAEPAPVKPEPALVEPEPAEHAPAEAVPVKPPPAEPASAETATPAPPTDGGETRKPYDPLAEPKKRWASLVRWADRSKRRPVPFASLAPLRSDELVSIDIAVIDPDTLDGRMIVGVQKTLPWVDVLAAVPLVLVDEPGDARAASLGNVELGAAETLKSRHFAATFATAVALPTMTVDRGAMAGGQTKQVLYARRLLDVSRMAYVVPGLTTFRFAGSTRLDTAYVFVRLGSELALTASNLDGVVSARFDGELGFHLGPVSIVGGSVTRVGGIIGDAAGTGDNVLQTLGGTISVPIDDRIHVLASGAFPVIDVGGFNPFVGLGLELDHL